MKAYVITMMNTEESVQVATRCIKSAKKFGIDVEMFTAITPADDIENISKGIPKSNFIEKYSRYENCLSAFLSHRELWARCLDLNEDVLVLEHDAVFNGPLPEVPFKGVLSYGAPSYGKFKQPSILGVNKLVSKEYLPGAHAYKIKPSAAKVLIDKAYECAAPTDLYISNRNFAFVEEYYPWPIEAKDSFTTIQNDTGCIAKHNYIYNTSTYRVI